MSIDGVGNRAALATILLEPFSNLLITRTFIESRIEARLWIRGVYDGVRYLGMANWWMLYIVHTNPCIVYLFVKGNICWLAYQSILSISRTCRYQSKQFIDYIFNEKCTCQHFFLPRPCLFRKFKLNDSQFRALPVDFSLPLFSSITRNSA